MAVRDLVGRGEAPSDLDDKFWRRLEGRLTVLERAALLTGGRLARNRSRARSDDESLVRQVTNLWEAGITGAVELVQQLSGEELVDLTWGEAFKEVLEIVCRRLLMIRGLSRASRDKDTQIRRALRQLRVFLRRGHRAHRDWHQQYHDVRRNDVPEAYRDTVRGRWDDWMQMVAETEYCVRWKAAKLRTELDGDAFVQELRQRLRIPSGGFRNLGEAGHWVYEREPPHQIPGGATWPELWHATPVPRRALAPLERVPVLANAARRLTTGHHINWDWRHEICLYLLRNWLDPLPKGQPRRWPRAERNEYLLHLVDKYEGHKSSHRLVTVIYDSGLSEEQAHTIIETRPDASIVDLEVALLEEGEARSSLLAQEDCISPENLRQIVSRAKRPVGSSVR